MGPQYGDYKYLHKISILHVRVTPSSQNFAKGQVMGEDDASVQLHENRVMLSEYEQNLLKAREELSSRLVNLDQDVTPPLPHNHNNRRKQSQITGKLLLR